MVALLAIWMLVGFAPALAPVSGLIWGSAVLVMVALAILYPIVRLYASTVAMSKKIARLRRVQEVQRKRISEAGERMSRLERALADGSRKNADVPDADLELRPHGRLTGRGSSRR